MTTSLENLAAWQMEAKGPIVVKEASLTAPGPLEIRIKVYAAPIQPAEAKQFYDQVMPRFKYPGILGSQCAGVVDKIGSEVIKVKVGDRVAAGLSNYAAGGDPTKASFQRYAIAEEFEVVKIGQDLSFTDAVALNTQTPPSALFQVLGLKRPSPEPPVEPTPKGQKILIWGGSSAMGALCICYAKLAGYEVITTCSPNNFDLVTARGADHIFDRNDPEVASKIKQLLPITFWHDTISLPDSITQIINIAAAQHQQTGEDIKLLTLLPAKPEWSPGMPEIPSFLKTQMHMFNNKASENREHTEWLMGTPGSPGYLERGLVGGWITGVPSKSVGGLTNAERGLEMVHENRQSGFKVVIEPWTD